MKPSLLTAVALAAIASIAGIGWAVTSARAEGASLGPVLEAPLELDFYAPPPIGKVKKKYDADPEACQTGCSIAKHDIPPFSFGQFVRARAAYAKEKPDAASKPLETLLFYRLETLDYLKRNGNGPLPAEHVKFLNRELARDKATVAIRVVGMNGETRVALEEVVPLGVKQHLKPNALDGIQPLEFNGTVKRVGLYHLWTRY